MPSRPLLRPPAPKPSAGSWTLCTGQAPTDRPDPPSPTPEPQCYKQKDKVMKAMSPSNLILKAGTVSPTLHTGHRVQTDHKFSPSWERKTRVTLVSDTRGDTGLRSWLRGDQVVTFNHDRKQRNHDRDLGRFSQIYRYTNCSLSLKESREHRNVEMILQIEKLKNCTSRGRLRH